MIRDRVDYRGHGGPGSVVLLAAREGASQAGVFGFRFVDKTHGRAKMRLKRKGQSNLRRRSILSRAFAQHNPKPTRGGHWQGKLRGVYRRMPPVTERH